MSFFTLTIDGDDWTDRVTDVSVEGGLGPQGYTISFGLLPGGAMPAYGSVVQVSAFGFQARGRMFDVGGEGRNGYAVPKCRASAPVDRLQRPVSLKLRLTTVQDVLTQVLQGSGWNGNVLGQSRDLFSFTFDGQVVGALEELARYGYHLHLDPMGNVELLDKSDPILLPSLIAGQTSFLASQQVRRLEYQPINQLEGDGGVPKIDPDQEDEEEIEESATGNGSQQDFFVTKMADEIVGLAVDGTEVPEGDIKLILEPGWQDAPVQFYNRDAEPRLHFQTPPADGAEITWKVKIRRATAVVRDVAAQTAEAARFGGDGVICPPRRAYPFITANQQLEQYLQAELDSLREARFEVSSELHPGQGIYLPGRYCPIEDSRFGYTGTLPVQRIQLSLKPIGWVQSISFGKGPDGAVSGSPDSVASSVAASPNRAGRTPPTYTASSGGNGNGGEWVVWQPSPIVIRGFSQDDAKPRTYCKPTTINGPFVGSISNLPAGLTANGNWESSHPSATLGGDYGWIGLSSDGTGLSADVDFTLTRGAEVRTARTTVIVVPSADWSDYFWAGADPILNQPVLAWVGGPNPISANVYATMLKAMSGTYPVTFTVLEAPADWTVTIPDFDLHLNTGGTENTSIGSYTIESATGWDPAQPQQYIRFRAECDGKTCEWVQTVVVMSANPFA